MNLTGPQRFEPEAALALIVQGEIEDGFLLYRQSLDGDHLSSTPVGLHLAFLENSGRSREAARLRAMALNLGANIAVRAGSFGSDLAAADQEYEDLSARGLVNSRMIYERLKVLAALGRMEQHAQLLAPNELLQTIVLNQPAPTPRKGTLASAVDELLLKLEDQAEKQEAVESVRNMSMIGGLATLNHPVSGALTSEIAKETKVYLAQWRASRHPLARFVPTGFKISAWGLISRGKGYNIPHIHHRGWATGVFYPRSVKGRGGELVIGRPPKAAGTDADWGTRRVRPEAGLLVLMPSFFAHWTNPLGREGVRTAVAFDVLPDFTGV